MKVLIGVVCPEASALGLQMAPSYRVFTWSFLSVPTSLRPNFLFVEGCQLAWIRAHFSGLILT